MGASDTSWLFDQHELCRRCLFLINLLFVYIQTLQGPQDTAIHKQFDWWLVIPLTYIALYI